MHPGELQLTTATVAALVADQLPQWADRPIHAVRSHGTVNALFRLGADLVARFPLEPDDAAHRRTQLAAEDEVARWLSGRLPVPSPEPVALGEPGRDYPLPWSVYRWLPGTTADAADVAGSTEFACDLAAVVRALWDLPTDGRRFAGPGRGGRLSEQDDYVAAYLDQSHGLIDVPAVRALWSRLSATPRTEPDRWTHGDLMPGNLLTEAGRLTAVIDVGGAQPADPALDLQPAWNLFDPPARRAFRDALAVDPARWDRGKGWSLAQAIGCLAYYRETNPVMSQIAARTLTALLAEQ